MSFSFIKNTITPFFFIVSSPVLAAIGEKDSTKLSACIGRANLYIQNIVYGDLYADKNNKISHLHYYSKNIETFKYEYFFKKKNNGQYASLKMMLGSGGKHSLIDYDYLWPSENEFSSKAASYPWQEHYQWTDRSVSKNMTLKNFFKISYKNTYPPQIESLKNKYFKVQSFIQLNYQNFQISPLGSSTSFDYMSDVYIPDSEIENPFLIFEHFEKGPVTENDLQGIALSSYIPSIDFGFELSHKNAKFDYALQLSVGQSVCLAIDNHYSRDLIYKDLCFGEIALAARFKARREMTEKLKLYANFEIYFMKTKPQSWGAIYNTKDQAFEKHYGPADNQFILKQQEFVIGLDYYL